MKHFFRSLLKPRQTDRDAQRQELILNILLLGSQGLAIAATLGVVLHKLLGNSAAAVSPQVIVLGIFFGLFMLSRRSYYRIAAFGMIFFYLLVAAYSIFQWDILLAQAQLLFVLVIIMSGILISSRGAVVVTMLSTLIMATYVHLKSVGSVTPDTSWTQISGNYYDIIGFAIIFLIINLVVWLSNSEMEKSLKRARKSEAALKMQRDNLETIVEERTADLRKAQQERMTQLYRFAEFGKNTSTILHDLVNPLSAVSLNLEKLSKQEQSSVLKRATEGIRRMESFIEEARRQIRSQRERSLLSLNDEIKQVISSLEEKAAQQGIPISFVKGTDTELFANPVRFSQLIGNLIGNAIDSYEGKQGKKQPITVATDRVEDTVIIRVADFGKGISVDSYDQIFEPFYTTKGDEKGMGLGLSICKDIVEKDFSGTISVRSGKDGSTFTISFPYHEPSLQVAEPPR